MMGLAGRCSKHLPADGPGDGSLDHDHPCFMGFRSMSGALAVSPLSPENFGISLSSGCWAASVARKLAIHASHGAEKKGTATPHSTVIASSVRIG
jgi:hypothetical protein